MANFALKNINKPTPKKYKRLGNAILIVSGGLATSFMGLPDTLMDIHAKTWVLFGITQISTIGKLLTSMFAETEEDATVEV